MRPSAAGRRRRAQRARPPSSTSDATGWWRRQRRGTAAGRASCSRAAHPAGTPAGFFVLPARRRRPARSAGGQGALGPVEALHALAGQEHGVHRGRARRVESGPTSDGLRVGARAWLRRCRAAGAGGVHPSARRPCSNQARLPTPESNRPGQRRVDGSDLLAEGRLTGRDVPRHRDHDAAQADGDRPAQQVLGTPEQRARRRDVTRRVD